MPYYSRYTFHFHLRIAAFEGFIAGIFLLNEFVARKTLHVSDWGIMLMLMIPTVTFSIALFWKPQYRKGKLFLWLGIPGRIVLLGMFFVHQSYFFILLIVCSSLVANLMIPVQNNIIKLNYGKLKGYYFGRATTISALTTITTASLFGWLLQQNDSLYHIAYPVAGIIGIISYLTWSRIRKRAMPTTINGGNQGDSDWSITDIGRVFKLDKEFRIFEINYFIYGLGFMMLHLTLPLYLVDRMHINYTQAGIARGLIFYTIVVFIAPMVGKIYDRIGPYKLSSIGFAVFGLFPIFILFSSNFNQIYASFVVFALAMACVNIVWNLGPVQISPPGSERLYMSIHMSLVGLRASLGYPLGILIKTVSSYETVFIIVFLLEIIASYRMRQLARIS
ncbi:MAG: hypothetical protein A2161_13330 [Candidatus Schekmanbacteria bacterium RBG_13_48_7]|uniref:Major facilitator superfamily (MFS) profile domain-containing protein n=1 Tax=Candidatus Schekmanbacteria bacterium RBG_13_48_7 TaxID=1817878 RepID=A0A1F7S4Q1_9BACT|nr:MAG: hypothetical protein A2161_13330 [Candidatus Schekmanbacteria bacterium RBG_13_48_7]